MQEFIDKVNLNEKIKRGEKIIIDLGGGNKDKEGVINVDALNMKNVDIVTNLEEGLSFLPDNSVEEIVSSSLLEHIDNFEHLMSEIQRVLKKGARFKIFVPHFSNPYYYSDYTHKRFFGFYTFYYFSKDQEKLKRKVPSFYNECNFDVQSIEFTFSSPFKPIRFVKNLFGKVINSNIKLQEFYEAHMTSICSCYGIKIELKVNDD